MVMTPAQQALYNRILDESLLEVERAGAGVGAPPAPSYAPPPAPTYAGLQPPPSRMQTLAAPPAPAQGSPPPMPGPAGAGGDILPNPYGSPGPTPAAAPPPPMFPVPQRMDFRGLTGEPGVATRGLSPDELARARANPISDPSLDVQGMRPFPSQRPSRLAMMAGTDTTWGQRRLPPPPMASDLSSGGEGRMDFGEVLGGIFPGIGRGLRQQRAQQAEMQARQQAQAAGFAHEERMLQQRAEADRAGRAPGEAMERERFAAWREDRDAEAKARTAASAAAEAKMRPDSGDSERRRAAFRAANPEFAVWMDKNDPEAMRGLAAGDDKTWSMVEARAKKFKAGGGGKGGGGMAGGSPRYAEALELLADGQTTPALGIAAEMAQAGDRKGAEEIRKLAGQATMTGRREEVTEEKEGRKRAEAERGMMIGGWERDPSGPTVAPAEVKGLRDAVAQVEVLRGIASELAALDRSMTATDRAKALVGIQSDKTAHAMELQGQALTAIRTIEQTGVPSITEMAAAAKKAPELTSADGWMNGMAKYRGLVDTMDMRVEKELGVRGYRRAGTGGQSQGGSKYAEGQTATGPGGQKMVFKGGKWGPL
jgi:hypothetical protein